jgi:hypothetical protein
MQGTECGHLRRRSLNHRRTAFAGANPASPVVGQELPPHPPPLVGETNIVLQLDDPQALNGADKNNEKKR